MKILIVDSAYRAFQQDHYAASPGLDRRPYAEQWRSLMDSFFGTADAYSHFLGELGHESHEVLADCAPLQLAWAEERGLRRRRTLRGLRPGILSQVLLAQVEELQPDVVYVHALDLLEPRVLRRLRRPGRLLAAQIASALPPQEQLRPYDVIFSSFPHYVDRFREAGIEAEHLRLAFDPRVPGRLGRTEKRYGASFVGSLGRKLHSQGNELLGEAAERVPIDFWGYHAGHWPESSSLRRRHHGHAWGLEMYRVLAESRIALNRHIDLAGSYANNMRLYEATGVGTLVLTEDRPNLRELFEPGVELVTYRDLDELVDRITYYLEHDEERERIATAGRRRTLGEHTWAHRMRELVPLLEARL